MVLRNAARVSSSSPAPPNPLFHSLVYTSFHSILSDYKTTLQSELKYMYVVYYYCLVKSIENISILENVWKHGHVSNTYM